MIRTTTEITPTSDELLVFTADEAAMSIRALSYKATVQYMPTNDQDPYYCTSVVESAETVCQQFNTKADAMRQLHVIGIKLEPSMSQPEAPRQLTPHEIRELGESLQTLGVMGVRRAHHLLVSGVMHRRPGEADYDLTAELIEEAAQGTFQLFKQLEPIALSKKGIWWPKWHQPLTPPDYALPS